MSPPEANLSTYACDPVPPDDHDSVISGPIPLPTRRTVYTVLRSPFVNKKSREQFQTKIHKRIVDILNSTPKTVESLMKLDLPAGVDIEIKV